MQTSHVGVCEGSGKTGCQHEQDRDADDDRSTIWRLAPVVVRWLIRRITHP
jgi:hypothetical protein